uniref:J domain-containing protein n=1 Tax=Alexandrium monilatum TaxID=311494 RepID=A0A7S4WAU6_9DINO
MAQAILAQAFRGMAAIVGEPCPYAVLGLPYGASVDEVRAAFRRAALRTHPDKRGGSCEAFNAVQRAHDLLLGGQWGSQLPAFAASGYAEVPLQQQPQTHWSGVVAADAFGGQLGGGCVGAAAAATFDPWSSATFDPWGSAAPDPWTSAAFDPWSSSTFDPWSSSASNDCLAATTAAAPAGAAAATSGAAAPEACTAIADPSAAAAGQSVKRTKRKRRPDPASVRVQSRPRWRKGNGKGCPEEPEEDHSRELMRNGVYGFRPSSSSEDESEVELAAPPQPPATPPAAPRLRPVAASCGAGSTPLGSPGCRPQPQLRQFYCCIHRRLRFEDALIDDAEGNPICRPGMECP